MTPITVSVGPLVAANTSNIKTTSTPTAGSLTLNGSLTTGGVAILDKPRRILITNGASEVGNTFTITGTNWSGNSISEVLAGAATAFYSTLDYATVTSIVMLNNAAGTIIIGTNGIASSPWINLDNWALPVVNCQVTITGTVNYSIQASNDDPTSPTNPVAAANMTWDTAYINQTSLSGAVMFAITAAPKWIRVLLNSGAGSASLTAIQAGVVSM